jgi:pimeloyl-ACP methyl ester carboxylesterase
MLIPFDDFYLPSSDGLRLHARVYGEANRDTVPVVCLPGLTRNAHDFHDLAVKLSGDGFNRRVIVMEYRGRGQSDDDPDWRHYTIPVEAVDVRQMLAALGVTTAVMVGTSRGGLITMLLAVTHPAVIKACILNDIGPVIEIKGLARIAGYVGKGAMPKDWVEAVERLRAANPDFTDLTDAEWDGFARLVFVEDGIGFRLSYDPALGNTLAGIHATQTIPPAWPLFDALASVPMMVLRGQNSDLLSEATLAEMAKRHEGLEALTVPNEGHAPFVGRGATAEAVARFVMRVG